MSAVDGGGIGMLVLLGLVDGWAGCQNALAGGGSFVTLPALILSGLDARTANIVSTLALFPGQVTTGWVGRRRARGAGGLGFRTLVAVSLAGGAIGAALLLLRWGWRSPSACCCASLTDPQGAAVASPPIAR